MTNNLSYLSNTAQKAIVAYGGSEMWEKYKYIEAEVSANGLAFKLKRRPAFNHATLKIEIRNPYSKLTPIGKNPDISGVLIGNDVRLENSKGEIIEERKNPRSFFPLGRRFFKWDDLDMRYFANYAFWTYFPLPYLLTDKNIVWTEKKVGVLQAVFPENFPTHSKIQEFIFDTETGFLVQHNYTVDIFGKWAKVANVIRETKNENRIIYDASRLVTPRKNNGKPRKIPKMIDITVHSFKFSNE